MSWFPESTVVTLDKLSKEKVLEVHVVEEMPDNQVRLRIWETRPNTGDMHMSYGNIRYLSNQCGVHSPFTRDSYGLTFVYERARDLFFGESYLCTVQIVSERGILKVKLNILSHGRHWDDLKINASDNALVGFNAWLKEVIKRRNIPPPQPIVRESGTRATDSEPEGEDSDDEPTVVDGKSELKKFLRR